MSYRLPEFKRRLDLSEGSAIAAPAEDDQELITCPLCKLSFQGRKAISNHLKFTHPEASGYLPAELSKRLAGKKTLPEMLREVLIWIAKGPASGLSQEVIAQLEENDAKIHVALRVIASERLRRSVKLLISLQALDREIAKRFTAKKLEGVKTVDLVSMRESLSKQIDADTQFLKEVALMLQAPSGVVTNRLVQVFGTIHETTMTQKTITDGDQTYTIPETPREREELRKDVQTILAEMDAVPKDQPQDAGTSTSPSPDATAQH